MNEIRQADNRPLDWIFLIPGEYGGRCGIVDYSLRLAREVVLAGGSATLASFRPVSPEALTEFRAGLLPAVAGRCRLVELPPEPAARWAAFEIVLKERPEAAVSVQFYPQMFKGDGHWFFPRMKPLGPLLKGRRTVVMAHELSRWLFPGKGVAQWIRRHLRGYDLGLGLRSWGGRAYYCSNALHARELALLR